MIINIISIVFFLLFSVWTILSAFLIRGNADKIKQLDAANKKLINDINSLQRNQNMIVSSFKELNRIIRKHDKGTKKIGR